MGNQQPAICGAICDGVNNSQNQKDYELSKIYSLPQLPSKESLKPQQQQPQSQIKPPVIELPQLIPQVLEVFSTQKPFQQPFNLQPNKVIRKIQNDFYHGPLDEHDKPTQIGRLYKPNGALLIATFINGLAHGSCFYIMPNGSYYRGQMKNNVADSDSNAEFVSKTIHYKGAFKNNLFDGQGQESSPQKNYSFKGTYQSGKKIQGTMVWTQKNQDYQFIGTFDQNGQFSKGKYTDPQGTYQGSFLNGKKHGFGIYYFKSKLRYEGEYFGGKKHGKGKIVNFDGSIAYEGTFQQGMPHGKGIATSRTGQVFEAFWDHGIDIRHLSEK